MKKVYEYNIQFSIYVPECKKTIKMVASIHSNLKEIAHKLCDQLGFDSISTVFEFYIGLKTHMLNPQATLHQINIEADPKLTAKIVKIHHTKPHLKHYTKDLNLFDEDEAHLYQPPSRAVTFGIIVDGVCVNERCVHYQKDVQIPVGVGEFTLHQLTEQQKCPACPYQDRGINPSVAVKHISLNNCQCILKGQYKDKKGLKISKTIAPFTIHGKDNLKLYKVLEDTKWESLDIKIKPL